jgi:hypothetical protein
MKLIASLSCVLALALSVVARDDRLLVTHADDANFCATWQAACTEATPAKAVTLSKICQPGDYQGKNTNTVAKVTCSIGNPNVERQLTILTQYVASVVGATTSSALPQDACS